MKQLQYKCILALIYIQEHKEELCIIYWYVYFAYLACCAFLIINTGYLEEFLVRMGTPGRVTVDSLLNHDTNDGNTPGGSGGNPNGGNTPGGGDGGNPKNGQPSSNHNTLNYLNQESTNTPQTLSDQALIDVKDKLDNAPKSTTWKKCGITPETAEDLKKTLLEEDQNCSIKGTLQRCKSGSSIINQCGNTQGVKDSISWVLEKRSRG